MWSGVHQRSIYTMSPKFKATMTLVEMVIKASSRSPRCPAQARVMTHMPYRATRPIMARPTILHNFLDSFHVLLHKPNSSLALPFSNRGTLPSSLISFFNLSKKERTSELGIQVWILMLMDQRMTTLSLALAFNAIQMYGVCINILGLSLSKFKI